MNEHTQKLPASDDQAPATPPTQPWYRRRTPQIITACAVAAVVATGGGIQIARTHTAGIVADLTAQITDQEAEFSATFTAAMNASEDAKTVYAESEGRVTDEGTRQAVADLLAADDAEARGAALARYASASPQPLAGSGPANVDEARGTLEKLTVATRALARSTTQLTDATAAVRESMSAWNLAQTVAGLDQTVADLTASIDNATAVLTGSEGKVGDDTVRQTLAATIQTATGIRDTAIDRADLTAVQGATATLGEQKGALDAATQTVTDAQGAWQADQDAQASKNTGGGATRPKNTGGGTSKPKGNTGGGTTSPKSNGGTGTTPEGNTGGGSGGTGGGSGGTGGGGWTGSEGWSYNDGGSICPDAFGGSRDC